MSKYIKNIPLLQFLTGGLRYQSKARPKCKPKRPEKGKKPAEEPPSKASTFRLLSFVALGIVTALAGYVFTCKEEHKRPEFIPYPHLRLRHKGFPWGDGNHSFFHNRNMNPLPQGYEDDIERKEQERLEKERLEEEKKNKGKKPKPVEQPVQPVEPAKEPEQTLRQRKKA